MQLPAIQEALKNPDYQYRLKAIQALHHHPSSIAIPLLIEQLSDREFLVRTFIAMALAKHQSDRSFTALLEIMKFDDTPSVRAEAANSLSLFGRTSLSHLVTTFIQDDHWLLRRSILAAILDMDSPSDLLEICLEGLKSQDIPVQEACLQALGTVKSSPQQSTALETILQYSTHNHWSLRRQSALSLRQFMDPVAIETLKKLRQDPDHRVVAATLEELV